jgi:nicotinamidase/pyrazinamidase
MDNDKKNCTEMETVLKKAGVTDVVLAGVATDYCVGFSAIDAHNAGFKTTVVCFYINAYLPMSYLLF